MNILTEALRDALSLGAWYQQASWAVDGLVYLALFTGLAKVALGKQFTGRGGTAVIASVGLALAVGAATFAYRAGFALSELGPLAWLVLLGLMALLVSNLARSWGVPVVPAVCIGVLASGITLLGLAESLSPWLADRGLDGLPELIIAAAALGLVVWVAAHRGSARLWSPTRGPDRPASVDTPAEGSETEVRQDAQGAFDLEGSILELLGRLRQHVETHGCDQRARALLDEILRRERLVGLLYRRMLRVLAARRWKDGPERQRLPDELARVLIAAKENISAFERLVEVLRAGLGAGNLALVLPAIERLIALERRAIEIAAVLRDFLIHIEQSDAARSDPVAVRR